MTKVQSFKSWNQVFAGLSLRRLPSIFPCIRIFSMLFSDVSKEPHLPLRHTLSQHQNRPNLVHHPFIVFRSTQYTLTQSSITRQFEFINTLLVINYDN